MEDEEFIIVETPDGEEIEFPSSMSDADINAAMRQLYPSEAAPGIGVTPAPPPQDPAARTGGVVRQADEAVRQIQDVEAADLDARKGPRDVVVRDPNNNSIIMGPSDEPFGEFYVDPRDWNPDATYLDEMDFGDFNQQAPILMQRGATLGAGDELAGLMAPLFGESGEDVREVVNRYYSQAYEDNPLGAMLMEGAAALPVGLGGARTMARMGMGPRYTAATEGAIYGFADPFTEGDNFLNRTYNAIGGGVGGRFLGGIGAGTANQVQRQRNVWSGVDTIQKVADEEFGITLTEGQIKGDPKLRGMEDSARKGALSDSANEAARETFREQERAATVAARDLGGSAYAEANDAAAAAADGIRARVGQRRDEITEAYAEAGSYGAQLREEGVAAFPGAVRGGLSQQDALLLDALERGVVSGERFPGLLSAMRMVDDMAVNAGGPLDFQLIEQTRRNINRLIDNGNPEDAKAVLAVKRAYDAAIDDAVESALFNGDDAFIGAYRNARALNARFEREWGANKVYERIVENNASPEQVISFILGGSKLAGDKNYDVLLQLKDALRDDPEAWAALQEAYVKKVFRQSEKTFNPKVMRDTLDEMLIGKNQSFAMTLLSDDQYAAMRRFRSVVDSMIPPDGAINTSNSGILLQRMQTSANDLFTGLHATPGVRFIGRSVMGVLDKYGAQTQGRRVKRQLNPPRGTDTRPIESGFPENRFAVPEGQLPGAGTGGGGSVPPREARTLDEGIDQIAGQPAPAPANDMAAAMNPPAARPTFGRRQAPPERVTEEIPESAYLPDEGQTPPVAPQAAPEATPRMNKPQMPTTLTQAVRNLGGIKTTTNRGLNLSRGDFQGVPGMINDRTGRSADDMVRALQEDGFDIVDESDLFRALDNERLGNKTHRIGEGELYEAELDAYDAYLREYGDDPVQNGLPAYALRNGAPTKTSRILDLVRDGKTIREIATEVDSSPASVRVTLNRLRAAGFEDAQPSQRSGVELGWNDEREQFAMQLVDDGVPDAEVARRVNEQFGEGAIQSGRPIDARHISNLRDRIEPERKRAAQQARREAEDAAEAARAQAERDRVARNRETLDNMSPEMRQRIIRDPRSKRFGEPLVKWKVYEMDQSGMTADDIADEMETSKKAVQVMLSGFRRDGYPVRGAIAPSPLGVMGEKREMAILLKREGLSNGQIAERLNAVYGPDAVHGGTRSTAKSVSVLLSRGRSDIRDRGGIVDFSAGVMLPSAAASMGMLQDGKQNGGEPGAEEMANALGTDEEKRAAMARAMLGGR